MRLHIETLFTHDEAGRMLRVNEPSGKEAPRVFVGRTTEGVAFSLRHDVEPELAKEIEAVIASEKVSEELVSRPYGVREYSRLLERASPVMKVWAGPAYHFPSEAAAASRAVEVTTENAALLRTYFAGWLDDEVLAWPLFALVENGHAVSICASVRKTDVAHEAGVETADRYRGRGYAGQVVSAWGAAVRALGCIPLYSTSWDNRASQAVASKLRLVRYGADLHLT